MGRTKGPLARGIMMVQPWTEAGQDHVRQQENKESSTYQLHHR